MFIHQKAAIAASPSGTYKKPPPDNFWVTFGFLLDQHTDFHPGRWKRAKAGADLFNRIIEDRVDISSMSKAAEENLKRAVELYNSLWKLQVPAITLSVVRRDENTLY